MAFRKAMHFMGGLIMRGVLFGVMVFGMAILALTAPRVSWGSETGNPVSNKEAAAEDQGDTDRPDQKKATPKETEKTLQDKSVTPSNPAGEKKAEETPATQSLGKVKEADSKQPSKTGTGLKKNKRTAEEDRPWMIKEHPDKKSRTPKKAPLPLAWESDTQQSACKTRLKKFRKTFEKARTYSIRGDHCATAKYAKDFLEQEAQLRRECPSGFLEQSGYSEKIIQNLRVLLELGQKACLEK
jgi:hypothetical protein